MLFAVPAADNGYQFNFPSSAPAADDALLLDGLGGSYFGKIDYNKVINKPIFGSAAFQNVGSFLQTANNFSDVPDINAAKTNLHLATVASTGAYTDISGTPDLSVYAHINSPVFTGNPQAPTQTASDNSTRIATTQFVKSQNYLTSISGSQVTAALGYTPADAALIGANSGIATLDSSGTLTASQIPASIRNPLVYISNWNANTNSPPLASGVGTKGYMYTCSVAGTTNLDGINTWYVGDKAVFNGTIWEKLDGTPTEVVSVAGRVGAVTLAVADITGAAPLAGPTFTGNPQAPTPLTADNSTSIATTQFVKNQGYSTTTGTVTSVATDATLTGGTIVSTGTLGINLGNANTWTNTQTFSNQLISSMTAVLNSANVTIAGSYNTGGTATTTKPAMLFQPNGQADYTGWSTTGTLIGGNVPTGLGHIFRFVVNGSVVSTLDSSGGLTLLGTISTSGGISAGAAQSILWSGRSRIQSPSDGVILLTNQAATGFTRLVYGVATSSGVGVSYSGTGLTFGLGDGTAGGSVSFSGQLLATANGALSNPGVLFSGTPINTGGTTTTTVPYVLIRPASVTPGAYFNTGGTALGIDMPNGSVSELFRGVYNGVMQFNITNAGGFTAAGNGIISGTLATTVITGTKTGLGTVSTDGLIINNSTAATVGTPVQLSPRIRQSSQAYDSTATTTKQLDYWWEIRPVSGTSISGSYVLSSLIQGGSQVDALSINTAGVLTARMSRRSNAVASGASIAVAADVYDLITQTNTGAAGTLTLSNPTNTVPLLEGQRLEYRIKCTNAQTLAFGTNFRFSSDLTTPSATTGSSKTDYLLFAWNSTDSKWDFVSRNFGF